MNYEINVLVGGRPVDTYQHEGETYIEGRKSSEYKIRLRNNTSTRALFIVSVDGLSIMDGQPASSDSKGYVLTPNTTLDVDGWLVDNETAAKFVFGSKESSYAESIGESTDNTGVIGLQVFAEKQYPIITHHLYHHTINDWSDYFKRNPIWYQPAYTSSGELLSETIFGASASKITNNARRISTNSIGAAASAPKGLNSLHNIFEQPGEISSLATEFGEATSFNTKEVSFERSTNSPIYIKPIYYDNYKNLNKLGIMMSWQKAKPSTKPNPFPGNFCKKPEGWSK